MSLPLTAITPDYTRRRSIRRMSVIPASTYPTGGDPIDFTAIANPNFEGNFTPGTVPTITQMQLENVPGGYDYQFVAGTGTTLATAWKVKFFTTAGTELAAGAYPAALLGANITLIVSQPAWAS